MGGCGINPLSPAFPHIESAQLVTRRVIECSSSPSVSGVAVLSSSAPQLSPAEASSSRQQQHVKCDEEITTCIAVIASGSRRIYCRIAAAELLESHISARHGGVMTAPLQLA